MLKKEKDFIDEYLKSLKPIKRKWPIILTILLTPIAYLLYSEYLCNFSLNFPPFTDSTLISEYFFECLGSILSAYFNCYTLSESASQMLVKDNAISLLCTFSTLFLFFFTLLLILDFIILIHLPINLLKYSKAKHKTNLYYKKQCEAISVENASKKLSKLRSIKLESVSELNNLFTKYNIDSRLKNRENLELMLETYNKKPQNFTSIYELQTHIISNNRIQESFPSEIWAKGLLFYDPKFTYYSSENPWLAKHKNESKKENKVENFFVKFIKGFFLWPIYLGKHMFEMLKILLGVDEDSIEKAFRQEYWLSQSRIMNNPYSTIQQPSSIFSDNLDFESSNPDVLFYDGKGNLCTSSGLFYDAKGNLCEADGNFYDFKGNYCGPDTTHFYDSRGNLCERGGPFYDGKDNLIFP